MAGPWRTSVGRGTAEAGAPLPPAEPFALRFQIGARTLWQVNRNFHRVRMSLADTLAYRWPVIGSIDRRADGVCITSLPVSVFAAGGGAYGLLKPVVRQRYTRHFINLAPGYDRYLANFSSKSRGTLLRKCRRLAVRSGGEIDMRVYQTPDELDAFLTLAKPLADRTYQAQLLNAGIPGDAAFRACMRTTAAGDGVRAFLLFMDGHPIAYLYLPAEGDTLRYAYLGYDPEYAEYSPGTVLQLEALRWLMAEGRFGLLDFTEGEGQHKRQFATDGVECLDLLLIRRSPGNLIAVSALILFDAFVARIKRSIRHDAFRPMLKAIMR